MYNAEESGCAQACARPHHWIQAFEGQKNQRRPGHIPGMCQYGLEATFATFICHLYLLVALRGQKDFVGKLGVGWGSIINLALRHG